MVHVLVADTTAYNTTFEGRAKKTDRCEFEFRCNPSGYRTQFSKTRVKKIYCENYCVLIVSVQWSNETTVVTIIFLSIGPFY